MCLTAVRLRLEPERSTHSEAIGLHSDWTHNRFIADPTPENDARAHAADRAEVRINPAWTGTAAWYREVDHADVMAELAATSKAA